MSTGGIGDALALATIAHHGQKPYGDQPYITHPIAVARLLEQEFGMPHLTICGLLHDTVEDTFVTLADITDRFGRDVADTVDAVTRRKGELYIDFVRRASRDFHGRLVKLADNTHNLSGLPAGDPREGRYFRARAILVAANGGEDPWARLVPDEWKNYDENGDRRG